VVTSRAREVLGWTSQTKIEEGLRLTWEASEHA
jgi:nucleoside-diphosphate-sugar epimerase